jgi:sodium transport system ATP-binding protein
MILMTDVHKRFGKVQALDGMSFEARDGEITGLLGPNGAGKTTALRCIYGLTQPEKGEIAVDGHTVAGEVMAVRRALGVFTDKFGLYDRLTAREQISYFAELNGIRAAALEQSMGRLVDRLSMADIIDRRSEGFSQGQRMKVGLARALVHGPGNFVLDEPTRGLDVMSTRNLRALLRELREEGRCILFSSHVMQEVAMLCDRVVIIRDGQLCAQGSPEELCERAGESQLEEAFLKLIGTEEGIAA